MALSETITALLFDWDGTVVDTAQLGLLAFQKSFAALGIEFHQPTYETAYSPNWYSMYEKMGVPKEQWAVADELWMQHYGTETAKLLPSVDVTIRDLASKGYRMGVVSSGSDNRVRREVEELGLRELFEVIVCNEDMVNKKPHPEGLHTALRKLELTSADCCYVGDSPEDIQMGRQANVMTVGIRSAYPTSHQLLQLQPDIYLESFADLAKHF
jgi:HAD superfamily hydrolase (TIGR01549 family)